MRNRPILAIILWIALSARVSLSFSSARLFSFPDKSVYEPIQRAPRHLVYSQYSTTRPLQMQQQDTVKESNSNGNDSASKNVTNDDWLERTTSALLETTPGTLVKGKWHQILSMMAAWSRRTQDRNAPLILERLLKRAIDEHLAGNAECFPTTQFYNYVIDGWCAHALNNKSIHSRAASKRARQILHWLQRTHDVEQDPARRPNAYSFYAVLKAIAITEKPLAARGMLKWREHLYKSGQNSDAQPNMFAYVTVLDAFASSGMEDAGEQAEVVLKEMAAFGVQPTTLCYNIVIKAWNKSGRGRQSAEYAERILEEMKSPPDEFTYSSVIHAWATSGMKEHAAERAEEILYRLEQDESAQANVVAYNACLNAWSKSKSPMAVNRTEALLSRMEASEHVSPDLVSYNTYMHALAMAGKEVNMAQRADAFLRRWEERFDRNEIEFSPNLYSYNLVIEAWARSRDPNAATRASDVLRKLVKRDGVEPDAISFNQVINALSRSSLPGSAQKAEDLLHYMDEAYKSGIYDFKADIVGYTSAITAWSRSGKAGKAERAESLLVEMENRYRAGEQDLKPTTTVYNAVIDAHAKSGEGTLGARRAEALLQRMQAGDKGMQPNIITYNAVLNAWARSGTRCCASKAEGYLDKMWELYAAGNKRVKPDGNSYNTLINAISKSKNDGKAQKALRILRRMDKLYRAGDKDTRPNELTYTAVLNSCAFPAVVDPKSRKKALDTAIFTLAELQGSPYGKPNHLTYGTFLKACANLMPRDDELRRMVVEPVFLQCCQDGQVGDMVLAHLKSAAPDDLYRELLKDVAPTDGGRVKVQDLPAEWRRNVREHRRWPTRRTRTAVRRERQAVRQKQHRLAP